MTSTSRYVSPFGIIHFTIDNDELVALKWSPDDSPIAQPAQSAQTAKTPQDDTLAEMKQESPSSPLVRRVFDQLNQYFNGTLTDFNLPFRLNGTPFQLAVWQELQRVPYGTTISYGELAKRMGRPNAARAVGQALHVNPVAIVVPCHRILAANSSIGGYAPGTSFKKHLLRLENPGLNNIFD